MTQRVGKLVVPLRDGSLFTLEYDKDALHRKMVEALGEPLSGQFGEQEIKEFFLRVLQSTKKVQQ